jgi:hypothetical protein
MLTLDDKKVTNFVKAFQDLWVAGMSGTFFFFIWRSLAQDVLGATPQFATGSGLDRVLRYSFLFWLFGYFFIAAIENNPPDNKAAEPPANKGAELRPGHRRKREVIFDVVQSVFSVIAAVFLGFVLQLPRNDWRAYFAATVAVMITGGLSFVLFHGEEERIDALRCTSFTVGYGLALGLMLQSVFVPGPPPVRLLWFVLGGQAVLWIVLLRYVLARLQSPQPQIGG